MFLVWEVLMIQDAVHSYICQVFISLFKMAFQDERLMGTFEHLGLISSFGPFGDGANHSATGMSHCFLFCLETCLMKPSFLNSKRKFHSPCLHSQSHNSFIFVGFLVSLLARRPAFFQPTLCWHHFFILVSKASASLCSYRRPWWTSCSTIPTRDELTVHPFSHFSHGYVKPCGVFKLLAWVMRLYRGGLWK